MVGKCGVCAPCDFSPNVTSLNADSTTLHQREIFFFGLKPNFQGKQKCEEPHLVLLKTHC